MRITNAWYVAKAAVKEVATFTRIYWRLKLNFPKVDFGDCSLDRLVPSHKRQLSMRIARQLFHESQSGRINLPATGEIAISQFKYKVTGGKEWKIIPGSESWADISWETETKIKRASITVSSFAFAGRDFKLLPPFEMEIEFQR